MWLIFKSSVSIKAALRLLTRICLWYASFLAIFSTTTAHNLSVTENFLTDELSNTSPDPGIEHGTPGSAVALTTTRPTGQSVAILWIDSSSLRDPCAGSARDRHFFSFHFWGSENNLITPPAQDGAKDSIRLPLTKNPDCSFIYPGYQVRGISLEQFPWPWQTGWIWLSSVSFTRWSHL